MTTYNIYLFRPKYTVKFRGNNIPPIPCFGSNLRIAVEKFKRLSGYKVACKCFKLATFEKTVVLEGGVGHRKGGGK